MEIQLNGRKRGTPKVAAVTAKAEAPLHAPSAPVPRGGDAPCWAEAAASRPRGPASGPARGPAHRLASGLTGRRAECQALDGLLAAVQAGQSRVLVVHGEPGMGTTSLLEYLAGRAADSRVLRVAGVQSEMELAFAGLHQLCAPLLDRLGAVPEPQQEALRTAFGMSSVSGVSGVSGGLAPDRFLVGLAVLGLLSEVAGEQPVLCVVDDAHWLDRASVQVLAFVARRLGAESVGLVFGTRVAGNELAGNELAGLPELPVRGLPEHDARALLDAVLAGPIDERVRDEIVAETRGNPLALLELPRVATLADLAGGFGLPGALPLAGRIEDCFRRQIDALPAQARRLLLVAAADPTGDPALMWRAAGRLGIGIQAAGPATDAGLAEFGGRVRFRHPLVRSAVYRSASAEQRQRVHQALSEATDAQADPDRRAWHRAQAAAGPDEEVAAELERSAGRAQARGGLAAAAAFGERAAMLTADPARGARRMLAAAQAHLRAGAFGKALELLAKAEAGPLDELYSARLDWLRGQVAFASGPDSDAPLLLLKAARRLELLDLDLARETYLDAWQAATFAGHLAGGGDLEEVSRAARALPDPERPRPADLLLDGLARLVTDGPAAAAEALRQATRALADPIAETLRWGWMATLAHDALWDADGWRLTARQVQLARAAGALDRLPLLLNQMAAAAVRSGDLAAAAALIAEADAVCEATGSRLTAYAALMLAAVQGHEAEAVSLIEATIEQAEADGQGGAVTSAHAPAAVLYNGVGRYADALAAARQAADPRRVHASVWVLPEMIEAAARTGNTAVAADALDLLARWTRAGGTEDGLGMEARCRALLSEGEVAERLYTEAIDRLSRTGRRPDLARAHLLYGEWLRRRRRRSDARAQLRAAVQMLDAIGMHGFAERARRELRATGTTTRPRTLLTTAELTAQEAQIARLAADGLSNPEIAARLFLSPRTVQYHLGKVFTKLDIASRAQLSSALSGR
jgi:DNA-binding CsgD family transcriptional regulator